MYSLFHRLLYWSLLAGLVLHGCCAGLLRGQQPASLQEDMKRAFELLSPDPAYEMVLEYHWVIFEGEQALPQKEKATFQVSSSLYRMSSTTAEVMQNDSVLIAVYHDSRTIMINSRPTADASNPVSQPWSPQALKALTDRCTSVSMNDEGALRTYTFAFKEGLCETMALVINRNTGVLLKSILKSRPLGAGDAGVAIPSETMEIHYLSVKPIELTLSIFTLGHYCYPKNGKFHASSFFEGYQVLNYHTTLKP